jgi:glutamate dehydrogenase/leucine dehydrogenase
MHHRITRFANIINKQTPMSNKLKIVVIGGSGLIGKTVVKNLREEGHEVVAASPSSGVNTVTGEGLAEALAGRSSRRRCRECSRVGGQGGAGVF